MIVDFKEIPVANRGGGEQDQFEFFARDFFEALGYEIKSGPDRGSDDNRDLIIVGPGAEAIDRISRQWLEERLIGAYIGGLCRVRQEYLPEDIRNEFLDIMSAFTRIEPEGDEDGNLDATLKVMSNEDASSIVARIVAMYDSYRGALLVIPETRSGLWASFELSNAVLDR